MSRPSDNFPAAETVPADLTLMLSQARAGNESAAAKLLPLVYDELRRLARAYFRDQDAGHTLQPTALVHEAFVRLIGAERTPHDPDSGTWRDRAHFFAVAATAMRQILVDHARHRKAQKRGAHRQRVPLIEAEQEVRAGLCGAALEVLDLHEAMTRLAENDPRKAQVVEMRIFAGLTCPEVSQALGVSLRTVEADWLGARAWLRRELANDE